MAVRKKTKQIHLKMFSRLSHEMVIKIKAFTPNFYLELLIHYYKLSLKPNGNFVVDTHNYLT